MLTRIETYRSAVLALATALFINAPASNAQTVRQAGAQRDSMGGILAFVADHRTPKEIVEQVQIDCFTFPFESLDTRLKGSKGYENLTEMLMHHCSRLRVQTDPPNATLRIAGREVGTVPNLGALWWVDPGSAVDVSVTLNGTTKTKRLDFPPDKMLQVSFALPRDTAPLPSVRSARQVAADLGLLARWRPPATGGPMEPVPPTHMSAASTGILWGLIGAVGGAVAAEFVPSLNCVNKYTVTSPGGAYIGTQKYSQGTSVDIGRGPSCIAMFSGGMGIGLFTVASIVKSNSNRSSNAAYNDAKGRFQGERTKWEQDELAKFIDASAEVRSLVRDDQERVQTVQAQNDSTRQRNARIANQDATYAVRPLVTDMSSNGNPDQGSPVVVNSDVDQSIPHAVVANPKAVAVVIGNKDYQSKDVPSVAYAIRDSKSVQQYLITELGFQPENIIYIENASKAALEGVFGNKDSEKGKLYSYLSPDSSSDVFIYYSGHGAPGLNTHQGYFVPTDADPGLVELQGYPVQQLYDNLGKVPARSLTVVMDACFSGSSDKGALVKSASPLGLRITSPIVNLPTLTVFAASKSDQVSSWNDPQQHGLFTYYFLKGLKGEADRDSNKVVTVQELQDYVTTNVSFAARRLRNREQNPDVLTHTPGRALANYKNQ